MYSAGVCSIGICKKVVDSIGVSKQLTRRFSWIVMDMLFSAHSYQYTISLQEPNQGPKLDFISCIKLDHSVFYL